MMMYLFSSSLLLLLFSGVGATNDNNDDDKSSIMSFLRSRNLGDVNAEVQDVDECTELDPYPCAPTASGGFCVNKFPDDGFYDCKCLNGYTGLEDKGFGPTVCILEDSCFFNNQLCNFRANCLFQNNNLQYDCVCKTGLFGDGITFCSETPPSKSPTPAPTPLNPCDACTKPFQECRNDRCECQDGYFQPSGVGGACQDENECQTGRDDCDRNAKCTNLPGSFRCTCNTGFVGDGNTCRQRTPCDDCKNNASCVDNTCVCDAGYEGDGSVQCTDINECLQTPSVCENGTCQNRGGRYRCTCDDGFRIKPGSGLKLCEDINECAADPTICGNLDCFNTAGSYYCVTPLPPRPRPTTPPTRPPTPAPNQPPPTPSPTRPPTPHPTTSTLHPTTTTMPSPTPRLCDDSLFTLFTLLNNEGHQRCVWLASREEQQEIYCKPGMDAYDICEETCGKCTDTCEDTNGVFPTIKLVDHVNVTINRNCLWLSLRPAIIEEVCKAGFTAYDITCPETCNACDLAAPVSPQLPSPVPTSSPEPSPAPTNPEPTVSPSIRVNCDDDPNGKFMLNDGREEICVWLAAADRQDQRDIYCVPGNDAYDLCEETCGKCYDDDYCVDTDGKFQYYDPNRDEIQIRICLWLSLRPHVQATECRPGKTVYDSICPETCNSCDAPEANPTPSSFPTESPYPSPMPTAPLGTSAPTATCSDTSDTFPYNGADRTCVWLASQPAVRATICNPGFTAYDTTCPATCGACGCVDTDGTFPLDGMDRNCAWLASNSAAQTTVCNPGFTANDITCPFTCGACDAPTGPPTDPPTDPPTNPPTPSPTTNAPSDVPSDIPTTNCVDTDNTW
eukprot:CAMPEP_0194136872 /NCGR_PEP_ID=MMETSP0152-20130528/6827_1 /TAXON_ID=1049557 /ORGANISM="Thalassiothrix antarctica, Strain L6-D1" /LENGTH=843 /DNA_ID=CAMNT_0038833675 /DNA_START=242 /DNA_END=2770 /DNA_ORIENTATION=-